LVYAVVATTLTTLLVSVALAALSWAHLIATLLTSILTARLLTGVVLFLLCHYGLLRGALGEERPLLNEVRGVDCRPPLLAAALTRDAVVDTRSRCGRCISCRAAPRPSRGSPREN
jgi:hypothetical protein